MKKRNYWLLLDALFTLIGLLVSVEFYFSLRVPEGHVLHFWRTVPMLLALTLAALSFSGIYRTILDYAGQDILFQSGISTLIGTGITYLISLIIYLFREKIGSNVFLMPRPVYFIQWVITLFLIAASRYLVRYRTAGRRIRPANGFWSSERVMPVQRSSGIYRTAATETARR